MANPFAKKNPLMSMWLSAANAWAGAARGFMTAEMRRQQGAALKQMSGTTKTSSAKATRRRKRK